MAQRGEGRRGLFTSVLSMMDLETIGPSKSFDHLKNKIEQAELEKRNTLVLIDVANVEMSRARSSEMTDFMKQMSSESSKGKVLERATVVPLYDSHWPMIKMGELIERSFAVSNAQWSPTPSMSSPLSEKWTRISACDSYAGGCLTTSGDANSKGMMVSQLWMAALQTDDIPTIIVVGNDVTVTALPDGVQEFGIVVCNAEGGVSYLAARDKQLQMVRSRIVSSILSGGDIIPLAATSRTGLTAKALETRDQAREALKESITMLNSRLNVEGASFSKLDNPRVGNEMGAAILKTYSEEIPAIEISDDKWIDRVLDLVGFKNVVEDDDVVELLDQETQEMAKVLSTMLEKIPSFKSPIALYPSTIEILKRRLGEGSQFTVTTESTYDHFERLQINARKTFQNNMVRDITDVGVFELAGLTFFQYIPKEKGRQSARPSLDTAQGRPTALTMMSMMVPTRTTEPHRDTPMTAEEAAGVFGTVTDSLLRSMNSMYTRASNAERIEITTALRHWIQHEDPTVLMRTITSCASMISREGAQRRQ